MNGALTTVLVCTDAAQTVAPCPSGTAPSIQSAYLLAPSAQSQIDAALVPVSYSQSSAFWVLAFVSLVSIWSLSKLFSISRRAIR